MKQFLYFLTLFCSIGTVGLVATNPGLVQQGTTRFGVLCGKISEQLSPAEEVAIEESDRLAEFLADSPYAIDNSSSNSEKPRFEAPVSEAPVWPISAQTAQAAQVVHETENAKKPDLKRTEKSERTRIANESPQFTTPVIQASFNKQNPSPSERSREQSPPDEIRLVSGTMPAELLTGEKLVANPVPAAKPESVPFVPINHLEYSSPNTPISNNMIGNAGNYVGNNAAGTTAPPQDSFSAFSSPAPVPAGPLPSFASNYSDPVHVQPVFEASPQSGAAIHPPVSEAFSGPTPGMMSDIPIHPSVNPTVPQPSQQHSTKTFGTFYTESDGQPANFTGQIPPRQIPDQSTNIAPSASPEPTAGTRSGEQLQLNPSVISEVVPCHGTETIARVGNQVILMCDILPQLRRVGLRQLREQLGKASEEERNSITEEEKDAFLEMFITQYYPVLLQEQVNMALIYNDFAMSKSKEEIEFFVKSIGDEFDEHDIPDMMKEFGVSDMAALKTFLKEELGSSLERERMLTTQSKIAQQWLMFSAKTAEGECTHDEMMDYYTAHQVEFETKARAKYRELVVLFSNHANELEAWKKIVWMGNEVARGVPFDEMANVNSEGFTASKGGLWDWISRGSLTSQELENTVFTQPVGKLGPIVKTATGLHILQVVERDEDKVTPFIEAQVIIRAKIQQQRRQRHQEEYFAELKRKYPAVVLRESIDFKTSRRAASQALAPLQEKNR